MARSCLPQTGCRTRTGTQKRLQMGKGGQQPPRIHGATTKDEQRAALQAFAAMDIDGDGEPTAEEIINFVKA